MNTSKDNHQNHGNELNLMEKVNLIVIVLVNLFLLFLCFIKPDAVDIASSTFDLSKTVALLPLSFIVNFTKLFAVIIVSYSLSNLMGVIYFKHSTTSIPYKGMVSILAILWMIVIVLLLQVVLNNYFLIPSSLDGYYLNHTGMYLIVDGILGVCLGLITSLFIVRFKPKKAN